MRIITTTTPEETERTGAELARELLDSGKKYFVALYGDLGAGKTVFVRGFTGIASPGSRVKSPTYTIVNQYGKDTKIYHFDMYRISDEDDLYSVGYDDYLSSNGYVIAEWSENVPYAIPDDDIYVTIERVPDDSDARKITIESNLRKDIKIQYDNSSL